MKKTKKYLYFKWLIYIFEIYILFFLQQTPPIASDFFGVRPMFVIPAFVAIALFEKNYSGLVFGVIAGFLTDISVGGALGAYALVLGIIGYFLSVFAGRFLSVNFLTFVLCCAVVVSICCFSELYFNFIICGFSNTPYAVKSVTLPTITYSVFVSPIIFMFSRFIYYGNGVRGGD